MTTSSQRLSVTALALLFISLSSMAANTRTASEPEGLPAWELGAGLGVLSLPHYPGADQSQTLVLPFPMLIYRGETIRADKGALRGILYESGAHRFDISMRGSLPVNSEDNRARQGMADLDPTLEIGPQYAWTAHQDTHNNLQLRLPLRAVISVGSGVNHQGYVANPNLRWDHQFNSNFRVTTRASLRFGDSKWHDYFYAVSAADEIVSTRPRYDAAGGYGGSSLTTTLAYQHGDWRIGGGLGLEWLSNAAFADSPLVKDQHSYFLGFAISKVLWKSERRSSIRVDSDNE